MIIEQKYVKAMLDQNTINILPLEECIRFDEHVSKTFSWQEHAPDRIDWLNKEVSILDLTKSTDSEIKKYFSESVLNKYKQLGIVFSAYQPGAYGDIELVIKNLDKLSAHCPGAFFIVGIEKEDSGKVTLQVNNFIEGDRLKCILTTLKSVDK